MKRVQVLVIGGGPAGAVAARRAAEAGAEVLLVERRADTTGPTACTGLVSLRTLPTLGASSSSVLREIRCIEAHAPNEHRLVLRAEQAKGVVVDRSRLEAELLASARAAGADVATGTKAVSGKRNCITVRNGSVARRVGADIVIGADGARSAVAKWYGLSAPPRFSAAAQAILQGPCKRVDTIDVFVGQDVAPGFFAWAVPAEPDRLRVGVATSVGSDPHVYLARLIARRFTRHRVRSRVSGLIPASPADEPVGDGVLLVGDAAGQVKPLSGGGLYTGGVCAEIAGRIAAEAAISGQTDRETLMSYTAACREAIAAEVQFGLAARQAMEALTDPALNAAFAAVDHAELLQVLAELADIDNLHQLAHGLYPRRRLWRLVPSVLSVLDEHADAEVRV